MSVLADADVDQLVPLWEGEPGRFTLQAQARPGAPEALEVVAAATTVHDVEDLRLLASVLDGDGPRATDAGGFRIAGDVAEAWDGGGREATLSRPALARLLARLVDEAAARLGDGELRGLAAALRGA